MGTRAVTGQKILTQFISKNQLQLIDLF